MRLFRTEYWNPSTSTVRSGSTARGESLVDVESYFEPLRGALLAALISPGVADGLTIGAVTGQPGLTVATGTGIDAEGRVAVLSEGGAAIIDQTVPPDQVQNVPVVLVGATGVDLPTTGLTDDVVLTLTWREVLDSTSQGSSPTLLHAPWLRLESAATFADDGTRVVLATASLDATGAVTALGEGTRQAVTLPTGGLTFRSTGIAAGAVTESAGAQLRPRGDGGLDIVLAGASTGALSLQGDGKLLLEGDVGIGTATPGAGLDVDRGALTTPGLRLSASGPGWGAGLQLHNGAGQTYGSYAGDDGVWHFADVDHNVDRLTIDAGGNVRIGAPGTAARVLHVEGNEVHSGGPGAGFSFADRTGPGFVDVPTAGERWRWYAEDGFARLWSGSDQLTVGAPGEGGGLDVPRRIRLRQGPDASAGIWLHQNGSGDAGFIGMADDTHVGLWGTGTGFGLTMDVATGALQAQGPTTISAALRADGLTLPAQGVISGDGRLHIAGGELLYLLNHDGVIIGTEWGGNGNLTVEGALNTQGQLRAAGIGLPAGAVIAGDGRLHITGGELLYLLNHDGVVIGKEWGGNGNLTVEGALNTQGQLRTAGIGLPAAAVISGDGRLHITGGELLYLLNHDGVIIGKEWGGNGNLVVEGNLQVHTNLAIPSWSGGGITSWDVFAGGAVYVGTDPAHPRCAFYNNGTKQFVIDHPLDPENRDLRHVCIEGPEAAVFYRGSGCLAGGRAEVELPGYFEALTRAEDRTVMLTPVAEDGEAVTPLAASPVREGRFTVRAVDGSNPGQRFSWQVMAVRADVEPLEAERVKAGRVPAGVR